MRQKIAQAIVDYNVKTKTQDWDDVMEHDLLTADAVLKLIADEGWGDLAECQGCWDEEHE